MNPKRAKPLMVRGHHESPQLQVEGRHSPMGCRYVSKYIEEPRQMTGRESRSRVSSNNNSEDGPANEFGSRSPDRADCLSVQEDNINNIRLISQ